MFNQPETVNEVCPVCKGGQTDLPPPGNDPELIYRQFGWFRDGTFEWIHINCEDAA